MHWDHCFEDASPELKKETWDKVFTQRGWWTTLPSLITKAEAFSIADLNTRDNYQVVFATNREGTPHAQTQTRQWLAMHSIPNASVLTTKRKGDIAKAIDADYAIDDKAENVVCIHWIADVKPCKAYVLDRPYNQDWKYPKRVRHVSCVAEFIEDVRKGI